MKSPKTPKTPKSGKEGKKFPPKKPGLKGDDGKRPAKSPLRKDK